MPSINAKPGPVLGIETSCDETGVAVYDRGRGLLAHALYSQVELHAEYGGVVPELASRDHVRKLLPLIRQTLAEAGMAVADLGGVAYTAGPDRLQAFGLDAVRRPVQCLNHLVSGNVAVGQGRQLLVGWAFRPVHRLAKRLTLCGDVSAEC